MVNHNAHIAGPAVLQLCDRAASSAGVLGILGAIAWAMRGEWPT